jgi:hypothetical protein
MAGRRVEAPVVFTGGVALIPGMAEALAEALGTAVATAPDPQMTGALGAASIIRRVNGHESTLRTSPSRLAFAGAFVSYLFLTHLSYSLRALELLILVASRW